MIVYWIEIISNGMDQRDIKLVTGIDNSDGVNKTKDWLRKEAESDGKIISKLSVVTDFNEYKALHKEYTEEFIKMLSNMNKNLTMHDECEECYKIKLSELDKDQAKKLGTFCKDNNIGFKVFCSGVNLKELKVK